MAERHHSFIRSTGLIASLTLLSRLIGVARDCVCAAFFGAGFVWDAFSFAFRVPNLFRKLFGEGALSAAFLPVLTEHLEARSEPDAARLVGRVAGALILLLLGLTLLGEALLLGLARCLDLSPRWQLALGLTAVMLPYMVLICLTALAGAALHALRRFAAPALAPVVLNVCWILAVVVAAPLISAETTGRIYVVATAILVAGVLQLALQVAALKRTGFALRLSLEPFHPGVRRIAAAMAPMAVGLAALQLNVLLDGVIAISLAGPPGSPTFSLLGATISYPMEIGANSVLYYGARLMQFPLGVFGIALATAIFPALSSMATRRDWQGFSATLTAGLRAVLFIGIPAGVGLMLLRYPATELLFERGQFTPDKTIRTAGVVLAYSTAIWAYCAVHVLTRAFYSLNRPGTPAKVAAWMVALNLCLNLTLVWPLGEAGLAAATAASATAQAAVLYFLLRRRVAIGGKGVLGITLLKTLAATACMALACQFILGLLPGVPESGGLGLKTLRVVLPAAAGAGVFFAAGLVMRAEEIAILARQLCRRRTGSAN